MAKKELKKVFNLNSYEWWRNHRRVVTFGGFLLLFAWYLSPVIQDAKNKNLCTKVFNQVILETIGDKKDREKIKLKDYSKAQAYRLCTFESTKGILD